MLPYKNGPFSPKRDPPSLSFMPPPVTRNRTQSAHLSTAADVTSPTVMSPLSSVRGAAPPSSATPDASPVPITKVDLSASDAVKVVTSVLDCRSHNWSKWSVNFKDYLLSKHAWAYILGSLIRPAEAMDPHGADLWDANTEVIIAIMYGHCSLEEKIFLEGQTDAYRAWKILCDRHEQIGPIAQITLIQKLLQLRYRKTERCKGQFRNHRSCSPHIHMLWKCPPPRPSPS